MSTQKYPLGDQYYPVVGVEKNIGHAQVLGSSHLEIIQHRFVKTCGGNTLDQGFTRMGTWHDLPALELFVV